MVFTLWKINPSTRFVPELVDDSEPIGVLVGRRKEVFSVVRAGNFKAPGFVDDVKDSIASSVVAVVAASITDVLCGNEVGRNELVVDDGDNGDDDDDGDDGDDGDDDDEGCDASSEDTFVNEEL